MVKSMFCAEAGDRIQVFRFLVLRFRVLTAPLKEQSVSVGEDSAAEQAHGALECQPQVFGPCSGGWGQSSGVLRTFCVACMNVLGTVRGRSGCLCIPWSGYSFVGLYTPEL